jgi:hypothetical protein
VPVVLRRFPGLIHGFINLTGLSHSAHDAVIEIGGATRALLACARRLGSTAAESAGRERRGAPVSL